MTPLEIIKDAYDRAGVFYVARLRDDYYYLVLCHEDKRKEYREMDFDKFLHRTGFMEFYKDGSLVSY